MAFRNDGGSRCGEFVLYGNYTAPSGVLRCDGAAVSRSTYSALFAKIGTTYGAGDGSTTFNLPNFLGRFPVMWDGTGEYPGPGAAGGEKYHQLSAAEMPSHAHSVNGRHIANTATGGTGERVNDMGNAGLSTSTIFVGNTNGAGGDQAHNNLPPYLAVTIGIAFR